MRMHEKIQENIKKEYESKGYKVDTEVPIDKDNSFIIIDVVAQKDGKKIAIEVGSKLQTRLDYLKTKFDKVIHVTYLQKSEDNYFKHICGYTWKPRVKNPKECPKCKMRIDDE